MVLFQSNDNNMENFKIDLFIGEYGIDFPKYSHLSDNDCLDMINNLSNKFNMDFLSNEIAYDLTQRQLFLESIDAKNDFKLLETLKYMNVNPTLNIYINWYQFKDMDLIKTVDLDKYFYDILWFSSADDIDIFDENLNWIISIRHDGVVSYLSDFIP